MKKSNDVAIKLTNITQKYTIHHEKPTLVEKLVNGKDEEFWVYPGKCEAFVPGAGKT